MFSDMIHLAQGPAFHWKRMRSGRWTVSAGDRLVLSFTTNQGLVASSLLISVERAEREEAVVLLCLIGAFLALRELRGAVDASGGSWRDRGFGRGMIAARRCGWLSGAP